MLATNAKYPFYLHFAFTGKTKRGEACKLSKKHFFSLGQHGYSAQTPEVKTF